MNQDTRVSDAKTIKERMLLISKQDDLSEDTLEEIDDSVKELEICINMIEFQSSKRHLEVLLPGAIEKANQLIQRISNEKGPGFGI